MQSRLIVKNFGPINFVDLDLRNVNVFIGPQASGKSALAKLFTIFKAPRKFLKNGNGSESKKLTAFKDVLEEYNIASFLKANTEIEFSSELHDLSYKDGVIAYEAKLLMKIRQLEEFKRDFVNEKGRIYVEIEKLLASYSVFFRRVWDLLGEVESFDFFIAFENIDEERFSKIVDIIKEIEIHLSENASLYIPAERNFINIIKNYSLSLLLNKVPIPKHILLLGAELERSLVKEIDLNFLSKNLFYRSVNGEDRIFTSDNISIKLIESASGIQSAVPILIPILSRDPLLFRSFVIEEPELNLFPIAQYELIKLLESLRENPIGEDSGAIHTYSTHSPYILSALNNLLYAYKVKQQPKNNVVNTEEEDIDGAVNNIISADIHPEFFTAYQISNGGAESIFDRELGLIMDNYIDDASEKMTDDFDDLMNLMR